MSENSTNPGASRRRFLAAAGTGAAVVGIAAVVPTATADAAPSTIPAAGIDGPLVAFVSDASHGELTIMHGNREVVVHDKALIATLTHRLAKGA